MDPRIMRTGPVVSRRQVLRGGAGLAGMAVFGGLLSACGASGGDAQAAAGGQAATGPIIMVNYPGWMGSTEVADFKERTGIEVREVTGLTEGGSASQAAQLAQNRGEYDMALAGNTLAYQLDKASLIQQVDLDRVPNLAGIDARFRDEYPWGIPVEYGKLGIAYRRDLLPAPPGSWAELFEIAPSQSGRFTFPDYDVDVLSMAILALGYDINTTGADEITAAKELVIAAKPHLKAFLSTDAAAPLIEGSVSMSALYDYNMPAAIAANDQIGWISPAEGVPAYLDGWVALSPTEQTPAIEQFMNFHLEPEVYADFINTTGAAFLLPAAEPFIDEAILNNPALKLDDSVTIAWQGFIEEEGTTLRNRAWDEIKAA